MLASNELKCGKHSAVRVSLHRDFIKTGIVPEEMGKLPDFISFDQETVREEMEQVEAFIAVFQNILNRENSGAQ